MQLSNAEKLILIMLSDIYTHLKINGDIDPKVIKEAIYTDNLWGITWKFPGIFQGETSVPPVVSEVLDVLEMWSSLERDFKSLSRSDKARVALEADPFGKNVKFLGFSGNTEGEYMSAAHFLIHRLDRFIEFQWRKLDSHMPLLDSYKRMLVVYEEWRANHLLPAALTATDIIAILKEQTHSDNRK